MKETNNTYYCDRVHATYTYKEKAFGKAAKGDYQGYLIWSDTELKDNIKDSLKEHHLLMITQKHTKFDKRKLEHIKNLKVKPVANIKLL